MTSSKRVEVVDDGVEGPEVVDDDVVEKAAVVDDDVVEKGRGSRC